MPYSKPQNWEKPRQIPLLLHNNDVPEFISGVVAQTARKWRKRRVLFEQFFRRDGQPIGDLGRAIEDFQNVIAERTVKLARGSVPRGQFDPAEAGVAFGADDVAFSHARIMHAARNRSKTIACCLN
jgi:hypothetical protein